MQITLRKANTIQTSIQEAIKEIDSSLTLSVNEFQDVGEQLLKANAQMIKNSQRHAALLFALYNIRGLVGTANSTSGIDLLLTDAAFMDKRIAQLNEVATSKPMTDLTILQGQIEKLKTPNANVRVSVYGESSVSTTVVSQAQIDQARKDMMLLKKQKQKVNDQVLELNIKTEITLPQTVVTTLTEEGIA